jgi:hypothetical protein
MANRIADTARDELNNPVTGATASLRRIGGGEIDSTTTDGSGFYAFTEEEVGYPGPIFVRVTDTNGISRERTSNSTGKTGTIFMSDLARAFLMMTDGVFSGVGDELAVSADGVTMDLAIDDGMAFIYGHPCYIAAPLEVTVAANGNANPRIDLVVMRLIPPGVTGEGSITPEIVQGTPAASPVAPGATQDPNSVWEFPLAEVLVDPSVSSIAGGKVTDRRVYTSGPLMDDSVVTAKLADLAVTTIKLAANAVTAAKISNETNYSTAAIAKMLKANVSANATPVWASLLLSELADVAEMAPTNGQVLVYDTATTSWKPGSAAAGDVSSNSALSVDSEIALFSGTTGKLIKRAVITGLLKGTAGVLSAATAGTDYTSPSSTESFTNKTFNANGTGNSITNLEVADLASGVLDTDLSSVAATDTTLPSAKATKAALDLKSDLTHTHTLTTPPTGFATKTYSSTNVTSTATDGVEIAGFDMDIPSGGATVFAQGWGQMNAPASPGSYIRLGVKIGSQATDWGMENQTLSGERPATATSTRTYLGGASSQRISLRARVDNGTGSVLAAHISAFGLTTRVPAS